MGIGKSLKRGLGFFGEALEEGVAFGKKSILDVLKYYIVSSIAMLAAMVVAGVAAFASFLLLFAFSEIAAYALAGLFVLAGLLIGMAYSYAATFGATEFIYHNKRVGYFEGKNVDVAFKWSAFWIGIIIVLGGLAIGGTYLLLPSLGSSMILLVLAACLASIPIMLVLVFIMYYVGQELAIKKLGPIAAIRGSYRLVKNNLWETLVFSIGLAILAGLVQVPVLIVAMIVENLATLATAASGGILAIAGFGVIALSVIFRILFGLAVNAGVLIVTVVFYKKIAGDRIKTKKAS